MNNRVKPQWGAVRWRPDERVSDGDEEFPMSKYHGPSRQEGETSSYPPPRHSGDRREGQRSTTAPGEARGTWESAEASYQGRGPKLPRIRGTDSDQPYLTQLRETDRDEEKPRRLVKQSSSGDTTFMTLTSQSLPTPSSGGEDDRDRKYDFDDREEDRRTRKTSRNQELSQGGGASVRSEERGHRDTEGGDADREGGRRSERVPESHARGEQAVISRGIEQDWSATKTDVNPHRPEANYRSDLMSCGDLKFKNNDNLAKYARIGTGTEASELWKLLTERWALCKPQLVISVAGGSKRYVMQPQHRDILYRGLTTAASTTDGWIFSGGGYDGIMAHVGRATQDYNIGSGSTKKLVAIGVFSWGCVVDKHLLENRSHRTKPVAYESRTDVDRGKICLDCNHTHFILADDGMNAYTTGIPMLNKLEKKVQEMSIPVVAVLIGGGVGSLTSVHNSMSKGFPLVIVKKSGKIADLMEHVFNHRKDPRSMSEADWKQWIEQKKDEMGLRRFEKHHIQQVYECVVKWKERILFYSTISENGVPQDFDSAIFRALMSTQKEPLVELNLALAWNNVARAHEILIDNIQEGDLHDVFFRALVENKTDFLRLLLENGVDLRKFLDRHRLQKLYNEAQKSIAMKTGMKDSAMFLSRVGVWMRDIIGDGYEPPYQKEDGALEPWRDLFVWSVLQNRRDMALFFLDKGREDMMAGCLLAAKLLEEMAQKASDLTQAKEDAKEMEKTAEEFAARAVELQNEGYLNDAERGMDDVLRKLDGFGGTNALELAVSNDHKCFIAHSCTQAMLTSRWMGRLQDDTSWIKLVLAWFLVPFIPLILNFKSSTLKTSGSSESVDQDLTMNGKGKPEANYQNDDSLKREPENQGRCSSAKAYFEKLAWFYQCPLIIFWNSVLFFAAFLVLYGYVVLCDFHRYEEMSPVEVIVIIFILTIAVEEIRQVANQSSDSLGKKFQLYFKSRRNILDTVGILNFVVAFVLRFALSGYDKYFFWARFFYVLNFIIFAVRLLHFFSVSRHLGPKLVMIFKMMKDLFVFIVILVVFIGAFGVAQHALLFPNSPLDGRLLWDISRRAYWQMFGELFLEEIHQQVEDGACTNEASLYSNYTQQRCPSEEGMWVDPILLGLYLLFTQVLMLNLLIAIFSDTYSKVQAQTNEHWSYQRYQLIQEYCYRPSLAPPFIIFAHIFYFFRWIAKRRGGDCCGNAAVCQDSDVCFELTLDGKAKEDFTAWSALRGQNFVIDQREKEKGDTRGQLQTMKDQIGEVNRRLENMEKRVGISEVNRRLENMEKRIENSDTAVQKILLLLEKQESRRVRDV